MPVRKKVHLRGIPIDSARHTCAFFHTKEEQYRTLLPLMRQGIEEKEKQIHILNPALHDRHRKRLRKAGIDVDAAEGSGQLAMLGWHETVFRDGTFSQERMVAYVTGLLTLAREEGFPRTLLVADMEWGTRLPNHEELIEYEARLDAALQPFDDLVICAFDLDTFRGGVVMDAMRTHPFVIIGTTIQKNPFYVPPDEMLRELRERQAQSKVRKRQER